jgi:hypothetical protein
MRLAVAVGAPVSYCAAVHVLRSEQARFEVDVGAVDSNCAAVQVVRALHWRSAVEVGPALSNVPAGQAGSTGVHSGVGVCASVLPSDIHWPDSHGFQNCCNRRLVRSDSRRPLKAWTVHLHNVSVLNIVCVPSHEHDAHVRCEVATPVDSSVVGARISYSALVHAVSGAH